MHDGLDPAQCEVISIAKCSIIIDEAILGKLEGLGERVDEIVEKALKAGAGVVHSAVASRLSSSIGRTKYPSRSMGALQSALGVSPVKAGRDGSVDIRVGFAENRHDGGVNAKLASILEHGKSGQPARPFMKPAKSASNAAAESAMKAVVEAEMNIK
ncbi:hypothetical protein FACS1894184_14910 [Clostridia bacterium]|nr:hypothetical protein FACS1894184_14910 [Clostridia bacterium]